MSLRSVLPSTASISPAAATLFRRSFLRNHIAKHLCPAVEPSSSRDVSGVDDLVRDILAFDEFRKDLEAAFHKAHPRTTHDQRRIFRKQVVEATSAERFFYGYSELQLYRPVPIFRVGDDPKSALDELSDLILHLEADGNPTGVLLSAGSGSGKTVAMWKVWVDCLFEWMVPRKNGDSAQSKPSAHKSAADTKDDPMIVKLAGHLPCWLEPDKVTAELLRVAESPQDFILLVLAASCDLLQFRGDAQGTSPAEHEQRLSNLRAWLKWSPPLLLFCDLNHISSQPLSKGSDQTLRSMFADGLAAFQHEYGGQHRVIAAYRSQSQGDAAISRLRSHFTAYDMRRLERPEAVSYLRHLREFEKNVYQEVGLPDPKREVDNEIRKLSDLIGRTVREEIIEVETRDEAGNEVRQFERQLDPVISTPMLMHWVAQLSGEALRDVDNACDLYREVVKRYLDRICYQNDRGLSDEERDCLLIAMTRIALLLLAQDGETRVERKTAVEALLEPSTGDGFWWPQQFKLFGDSVYANERLTRPQASEVLEQGMFRIDDGGLGFLHDSLIYYFAGAVALKEFRQPGMPTVKTELPEEWALEISELFVAQPGRWRLPAEFLGGALHRRQSARKEASSLAGRGILEELVLAAPHAEYPRLLVGLLRDQQSDRLLRQARMAILDRSGFALKHPESLLQQVYNRLRWTVVEKVDCQAMALLILQRSRDTSDVRPPWLRLAKGHPTGDVVTMTDHTRPVTSLAVTADAFVISGSEDHTVKFWNPHSGEVITMSEHSASVISLAVTSDGRLVSGSLDGSVKVWDPKSGDIVTMPVHSGSISSVAVTPDGQVVSISEDYSVRLWDPQRGNVVTMDATLPGGNHVAEEAVRRYFISPFIIAAMHDGRIVYADQGNSVNIWNPQFRDIVATTHHSSWVTSLAILPDCSVVSASQDGAVKVWNEKSGEVIAMSEHSGPVIPLAVTPDGRVVSGSEDSKVKVWNPKSGDVVTMGENFASVKSLAVLSDGRVVRGGLDSSVKVWDPKSGDIVTMSEHFTQVTSLAVLPNDRVVSGSLDGSVKVWNPKFGGVNSMTDHSASITTMAILADGRLVSASYDNSVKVWDLHSGGMDAMIVDSDFVTSLAVLPDGRLIFSNNGPAVKMWDLHSGEVVTLSKNCGSWNWLNVLPGGTVVCESSGSDQSLMKVWDPHTGDDLAIIDQSVTAMAVLPDGRLVTGSIDHSLKIWEKNSLDFVTMDEHSGSVTSVSVLLDGRIVTGSDDSSVKVWDPNSGMVVTMSEHHCPVRSVTALPDGRIVSIGNDNSVKVWDLQYSQVVTVGENNGSAFLIEVLLDGRVIFIGEDNSVKMWDPHTRKMTTMSNHTVFLKELATLPDGRIAFVCNDNSVKVWDARTNEVAAIPVKSTNITCWSTAPRFALSSGSGFLIVEIEPWPIDAAEIVWPYNLFPSPSLAESCVLIEKQVLPHASFRKT